MTAINQQEWAAADMPSATKPLIAVSKLGKVYSNGAVQTHALRELSFTIARGDFVAIEGPSGGGKSSLLGILGLLDAPTTGRYLLAGTDVAGLQYAERLRVRNRHIGMVFQAFNLIGDLNVLDNVALPLGFRPGVSRRQACERAAAALAQVGMGHRLQHYPDQLSGGQQQRVAIARALVGEPDIILADEPTGNLDSENAGAVIDLFDELHARGQTILMVTHDRHFAARAHTRLHLLDGRLVNA